MKKVLILAYDFPPYVSVGGLRPYSWYKYFKEFGIYPIVVTRQWSNKYGNHLDYIAAGESDNKIIEETEFGTIIRTPYNPNLANRILLKFGHKHFRLARKIISAYYEFAQWIFNIGPKSELYFAAKTYLKSNKVDIIIATGDPFILFKYAAKLSSKHNIPWIADFRDPWTHNKSNSRNFLLKTWNKLLERKTVKSASLITTVSELLEYKISSILPNSKFFVLPNGFNPDSLIGVEEIKQSTDALNIGFVGTIYKWHPIDSFLNVIMRLVSEKPDLNIKINLYGISNADELQKRINTKFHDISNLISIFPKIPNHRILVELSKNNLLLLFNDYSIIGTKIFDYIGIKRKIIFCYSKDNEALDLKNQYYSLDEVKGFCDSLQADLISQTSSGLIIKDQAHLFEQILALYKEFQDVGYIKCNSSNFQQYSRKEQTKLLAEQIIKLSSGAIISKNTTSESKMNLCKRCIMDSSDTDITINESGHCNHCTNFFERVSHRVYQGEKSETDLLQIIDKIKLAGKKSKYDCVIGVSGGVDSSYLAYKAKKRGLRALLVHLDNGWNSEISVKNIKNLADILDFDYESFVLDWEEFKDLQLSFLRASVPEMETPTDIAILGALHKVAAKYGVKYILSGGNFATEGILPKTWHYDAKDAKYLYSIHKKFGRKKLKSFPMFGFKQEAYYKFIKGIKIVYLLNYIPYNKEESMKILQNELGWRYYGGKHYESKYTGFVQSYIMPVKFNMDYRRATFSTQICTGEVTREWALAELEKPPYNPDTIQAEKEYVCKKLGISISEFEQIMNEPPKLYRDYPNNEKMLQSLYRLYRKLTKTQSYKGD